MTNLTTTPQTAVLQPGVPAPRPVVTPTALETLQVGASYATYLEDRMGRYGY